VAMLLANTVLAAELRLGRRGKQAPTRP
jgi:hypothetical protein